jgi:hypothetical protein
MLETPVRLQGPEPIPPLPGHMEASLAEYLDLTISKLLIHPLWIQMTFDQT